MSRSLVIIVFLILVLVGGLFFFASRDGERPLERVETEIPADQLGR
ncbi:MAG: hypothetical protein GW859_07650 [Sphingomonadales bacterium]|nr:hypothetical protein [Sphingomonadales bacterium]